MQEVSRANREAVAELCVTATQTWCVQPGSALSQVLQCSALALTDSRTGCSATVIPTNRLRAADSWDMPVLGVTAPCARLPEGMTGPSWQARTATTKAEGSLSKLCSLNIHAVPAIVYTLDESLWICRIECVVLNGTEQCLWRWTARCVLTEALEAALVCCEGPWARSSLYNMRDRTDSLTDRTHSPWLPDMPGNTMLSYLVQYSILREKWLDRLCCRVT